jgi:hypothetical protein
MILKKIDESEVGISDAIGNYRLWKINCLQLDYIAPKGKKENGAIQF